MGTDSQPAEVQPGQTLGVVRHAGERFYELVVDGQWGGLVVYEEAGSRCVLARTFIAGNPEYLPLIDAARPGRWAKDQ